jgi:ribosome maturation factor RimP
MTARPAAADALSDALAPVVADAGLVLDDLAVTPAGRHRTVRVVVDLPDDAIGSVDLDTLADVTRAVSAALDADDRVLGSQPYTLEVSTPGAERPLTEPRHWRRVRTRKVEVVPADGSVPVVGRLVDVTADEVLVVDADRKGQKPVRREIRLSDVASGRVVLEFRRADADTNDAADQKED